MDDSAFDVVVIGAGPAGSRTAARCAGDGFSVLLLEKRDRIGYPVRCAEAVGPREDVERYLELDQELISSPINGVRVMAPDARIFEAVMPGIGFTVDRELFDRRLAEAAIAAGAELRTGHQAMELIHDQGCVRGVMIKDLGTGESYRVSCLVVVGADGVESLSPRWAGLRSAFRVEEVFSCAQELIEGIDTTGEYIEFHLGSKFAPGGYAWVFPKGPGRANVGIGMNPTKSGGKAAVEYLEAFLLHRCPSGSRRRLVVGGCEVARGMKHLVADGFVAVGEAAHQNNPFSGGGIINALEAADMAADALSEALRGGKASAHALRPYEKRWNSTVGKSNEAFYRAARVFYDLTNGEMDRLASIVAKTPGTVTDKGLDPKKLLWALVRANPGLLLKYLQFRAKMR
jgi:digeranylgeranylglycerophospholipid reductase